MFSRRVKASVGSRLQHCSPGPGRLVWIVGDIHGQDDLFERILRPMVLELEACPPGRGVLVLLGDYVDRGIRARQVVERIVSLRRWLETLGVTLVTLMGNHEDLLLRFLDQPLFGPDWCELGGKETLVSYGVRIPETTDPGGWSEAAAALTESMPSSHMDFFRSLPLSHTEGDFHCVHAGARFGVPLSHQKRADMLWLRDAFLSDKRLFEKIIVHGHTPSADVVFDDRRIGMDTGAYATGVLSALRLEADTRIVLQTRRVQSKIQLATRDLFERPLGSNIA